MTMSDDIDAGSPAAGPAEGAAGQATPRPLSEAAQRALAEAQARREAAEAERASQAAAPKEVQGRNGPEPVRYGDWEVKGLAVDF